MISIKWPYTALWRTLLKNGETDEALIAAEQGRAQALMDILKKQYGIVVQPSTSVEPKETISYMLKDSSIQTVFIALDEDTINLWLLSKGKKIQFKRKKTEMGKCHFVNGHCFKRYWRGCWCQDARIVHWTS